MLQRAFVKRELNLKQKQDEVIDNAGIDQVLRQEQYLRNAQVKGTQELLRTAWDQ